MEYAFSFSNILLCERQNVVMSHSLIVPAISVSRADVHSDVRKKHFPHIFNGVNKYEHMIISVYLLYIAGDVPVARNM